MIIEHVFDNVKKFFGAQATIYQSRGNVIKYIIMETDNRSYKRFKIHLPALVYAGSGYTEIECDIKDISEHGIAFEITLDKTNKEKFNVGDSIEFQLVDSFMFGREMETALICKKCVVRHITESEGSLIVGCSIEDPEFAHYVKHREVSELYFRLSNIKP